MKCVVFFICFVFLLENISASLISRIIGGDNADIRNFPYQASLRHKDGHYCGGCIISDKHILTAAHCIDKSWMPPYGDVTVSTGSSSSIETGNSHRIASVKVHPQYMDSVETSFLNDIAVITLADKISFDDATQQKISLASRDVVSGTDALIAGWGRVNAKDTKMSEQLQSLKTKLLTSNDCQPQQTVVLYKKQLCAYHSQGQGSCYGDSGGPLVVDDQVVGVLSWVFEGRCGVGIPEVYTNVYAFRDFVESAMRE